MNKKYKPQELREFNQSATQTLANMVTEQPSKTSLKKHMNDLQELGVLLSKIKLEKLKQLDLPEKLFDAIKSVHTINANGAKRRQYQYIGKLMRTLDTESIQNLFKIFNRYEKSNN